MVKDLVEVEARTWRNHDRPGIEVFFEKQRVKVVARHCRAVA
jgi:hypothetical protein